MPRRKPPIVRMRRVQDMADDGGWLPDDLRGYHPELTRCDHCGKLDDKTERVSLLENQQPHWLHPECIEMFVPVYSKLTDHGALVTFDRGRIWHSLIWEAKSLREKQKPPVPPDKPHQCNRRDGSYRGRDGLRQELKRRTIVQRFEDPEKTKAAQKFWAQFNDEVAFWASMKNERELLLIVTPI